jgi:nickel transport protein
MQSVFSLRLRQAALALVLLAITVPWPAVALDLFARHQVTVQFATSDGKPMANAEVRVFAPGEPNRPALTGHTDSEGKFEFGADRDGFWSAEARADGEVARATVRVGRQQQTETEPLSPYWLFGGLLLLLAIAVIYRILRARARRSK